MSEQCKYFGEVDMIALVSGASFAGDLRHSTIPNIVTCFFSNNEQCYAIQRTTLMKLMNK